MKELIYQEDTETLNMYTPNNRASKYVKQKLIELKEEIDKSTVTFADFNTPFSTIDRTIRREIGKDTELNITIDQKDQIEIYRTLHTTTENTHSFQAHKCSLR